MRRGGRGGDGDIFCHVAAITCVLGTMAGIHAARQDMRSHALLADARRVSFGRDRQPAIDQQRRERRVISHVGHPNVRRAERRWLRRLGRTECPKNGRFGAAVGVDHQLEGPGAFAPHRRNAEGPTRAPSLYPQIFDATSTFCVVARTHPQRFQSSADIGAAGDAQALGRSIAGQGAHSHQPANKEGDDGPLSIVPSHTDAHMCSAANLTLRSGGLNQSLNEGPRPHSDHRNRPKLSISDAFASKGRLDSLQSGSIPVSKNIDGMDSRGFIERRIALNPRLFRYLSRDDGPLYRGKRRKKDRKSVV